MIGDKELAILRKLYYGLLVQLLWKEPDPKFVGSLKDGLDERGRAAGQLNKRLGEGWRTIGEYLDKYDVGEIADEYTKLFMGPYGAKVHPYESMYTAGGLFKGPLIEVRNFLGQIGLAKKEEDYAEPEDALAFELEIMNWLIQKQMEAKGEKEEQRWLDAQAEFLKCHLLVWGPTCAADIENAEIAKFYRGVGALLGGLLEMEEVNFHGIGPGKTESLEEARKRHGAKTDWDGPTYDPENIPEPSGKLDS